MNDEIKPESRWNGYSPNKIILIIIGVGLVVGIGGVFGYLYLEDQQKQLQSKLDAEQKKTQQLESQKKQAELKAQQVQQQLQQQAQQKQAQLDQKQQELQQQQQQADQQAAQQQAQLQQQQQQAALELEKSQIITQSQNNVLIKGVIKGSLNFYIPPVPSYADPNVPSTVESIAKTLDGYNFYGVTLHRVYDKTQSDIQVQWIQNFGSNTIGFTPFSRFVQVSLGQNSCYGTWEPFTAYTVEKIFWHEFGHSMGFGHSTDPNNIMYQYTQRKFSVDYDQVWYLSNNHHQWIPLCGYGAYSFQTTNGNQPNVGYGYDAYIVPPNTNPQDVIDGKASYYDCSAKNKVSYTTTCIVKAGSYLLINNFYRLSGDNDMNIHVIIRDNNAEAQPNMQWDMNVFSYDPNYISHVWQLFHS